MRSHLDLIELIQKYDVIIYSFYFCELLAHVKCMANPAINKIVV